MHELDSLGEVFEYGIGFAGLELEPQGLDFFLETARSLTHPFDSSDVALKQLVDMYGFLKLELLVILHQFELFFVILDPIQRKDQDIRRIFNPVLIYADF